MTSDRSQDFRLRWHIAGALAGAMLLLGSAAAQAQLTPWGSDNNVYVDKSLMAGGNGSPEPMAGVAGLPGLEGGALLPPPTSMPHSRLLMRAPPGSAPNGGNMAAAEDGPRITLRPPSSLSSRRSAKRAPKAMPSAKTPPKAPRIAKPARPLTPSKPKAAMTAPAAPKVAAPPPPAPPVASKPKPKPAMAAKKAAEEKPAPETKTASVPPPPPAIEKPKAVAPTPPKKPAAEAPQQTASRGDAAKSGSAGSVSFTAGGATLGGAQKQALDKMAERLKAEEQIRLQLLAYAGEPNLSASKARRLSLSRALAVRSYLISKGVRSTRIDVRALGNRLPGGEPSRVDLVTK